jgi:dihydrofolate reductase
MRKLVLQMQYALDGFVGKPDGDVVWAFPSFDDASTAWIVEQISNAGVHVMGSHLFHDMIAHWPTSMEPYAPPMNEIPKIVFSNSGLDPRAAFDTHHAAAGLDGKPPLVPGAKSWAEAVVMSGDLATRIKQLKAEPGNEILVHGGAGFARSLIAAGLVDEFRLLIHPIALGAGLPIFSGLSEPVKLKLLDAVTFPAGIVAHVYATAS